MGCNKEWFTEASHAQPRHRGPSEAGAYRASPIDENGLYAVCLTSIQNRETGCNIFISSALASGPFTLFVETATEDSETSKVAHIQESVHVVVNIWPC
jgi:hypothetical protein